MIRDLHFLFRLYKNARVLARHDALFFLDRLPVNRAFGRLIKFACGPVTPAPERRDGERLAAALEAMGPSYIKLGQALSVRPDLIGSDLAADLGKLRDRLQPFSFEQAKQAISDALTADMDQLFSSFEPEPVAAASIAQVHFAVTRETADEPGRPVAVKVLRPGIEATFQREIDLFFWLAKWGERLRPGLRRLRLVDAVATVEKTVRVEMDLRMEAAAADEFAANFRNDPNFQVPAVDWPRSAERVLTMERLFGTPVGSVADGSSASPYAPDAAKKIIEVFLLQTLRDGFFHGDLHHGNLFIGENGELLAVDFGISGRLDKPTRIFMVEMLHAFLTGDYDRVAEVHFEAGYLNADQSLPLFAQACRSIGAPILDKPVDQISIGRLLAQLFQITDRFAMETQPQLLLLQKTMVTAEGVARSLDPNINFWEVSRPIVEQWLHDQLGPEARLKDFSAELWRDLRRLPRIAERAERTLTRMENAASPTARASARHVLPLAIAGLSLAVAVIALLT